ncbi:unnamed protein product, partial [Urochloa humidicola]
MWCRAWWPSARTTATCHTCSRWRRSSTRRPTGSGRDSGRSVEEVYKKILSVAGNARRCYDDASPPMAGLNDAEFADMMFVDVCFLLWYLNPRGWQDENSMLWRGCRFSYGLNILKDILRLKNQIPLLELEAVMD